MLSVTNRLPKCRPTWTAHIAKWAIEAIDVYCDPVGNIMEDVNESFGRVRRLLNAAQHVSWPFSHMSGFY